MVREMSATRAAGADDPGVPLAPSTSRTQPDTSKKKKDKKKKDDGPPVCHLPHSMVIVCALTELFFCIVMTVWSRLNLSPGDLGEDITHHPKDTTREVWLYWSVFVTFLLLRIITAVCWWKGKKSCHDSVFSGLFQFFCSLPFVCYLCLYYWTSYQLTYVDARQDVLMSAGPSNVTNAAGVLLHTFQCDTTYTAALCDAMSMVSGTGCCVQAHLSLKQPITNIPHFLNIKSAFNLMSWGSILALTMIWKDDALMKLAASDKEFMNGAWLDILDAVMFGKYVLHPEIVGPAKGINPDTKRVMPPDASMLNATFWLFVVSFFLSLLSPTLYTIFRYCDTDGEEHRTVANATEDLLAHIRLLDEDGCQKYVAEAIGLTKHEYLENAEDDDGDEEHPVTVFSDEKHAGPDGYFPIAAVEGEVMDVEQGREASASPSATPGFYNVEFTDGQSPKTEDDVPVSKIHADMAAHTKYCGHKCCWGWFRTKTLSPDGKHKQDVFERRAKFLDSVRSFFTLELPFFCFRLYFDVICGKGVSILLVKNAVWGVVDLMTILACGNEKATCLSAQPIISITKLVASTKLNKIMVAPAGLFRVATDCAVSSLKGSQEQEKHKLTEHKAWLILEREKIDGYVEGEQPEGSEAYTEEIAKLDKRLAEIDKIEKDTHI